MGWPGPDPPGCPLRRARDPSVFQARPRLETLQASCLPRPPPACGIYLTSLGVAFPPAGQDSPGSGPQLPGLVLGLAAWFQAEKRGARAYSPADCTFCCPPPPPPPSTACLQGQRRRPPTAPKCPLQSAWPVQLAPGQLSPRTCLLMRRARLAGPCGPGGPARAGPERCWHSIVNMG